MLILPDHPTPIKLKTHVSDPVPYVIYPAEKASGLDYSEKNAEKTGVYIEKGYELMSRFLENN
jgi:2,3-bisphosphoglycerate-independent phosphoglycerate mutase